MKLINSLCLALVVSLALLTTACKKEIQPEYTETESGIIAAAGSVPSYYFDWEAATYMPSLPNANLVPMPWNSGTSAIDPNLVSDYHNAEGWELVWNTFRPDVQLNDPGYSYYFALYNRYRGLLRFYLWQPGTALATNYVQHGLKLYGAQTSPMLIHNAVEMGDLTNKQVQFSQVLNQPINLSGTWLVFQYDINYDPTIAGTTFPGFGLEWDAKWASVSQILLNGNISGEIKGYIGNPDASNFNFGSFLNKATTTLAGEHLYGLYLTLLNPNSNENPYQKAMGNALNGIVKGFFNGIIGGTAATAQPVNLTINAKIKLDGTITTNGGILNQKLALPGQSNSQTADGLTPYYNSTMGVMTLSATPVVYLDVVSRYEWFIDPWDNYYYQWQFDGSHTLDNNSFNIIWNDAVINNSPTGATIENLRVQIVKTDSASFGSFVPINVGSVMEIMGQKLAYIGSYEQTEIVGRLAVAAGLSNSNTPLVIVSNDDTSFGFDTGIRVSFDVVPNNGAPRSKLVKTFKANLIRRS